MPPWGSDCSFYPPDDQFPLASDYDYEDLIDSGGTTELSGALVGDGAWWEMLLVYIGVPLSVVLAAMALTLACFCVVTVKLDRLRDRFNSMSSELCPENVPPKPSFSSSSSVYVVPIRSNHVANNSNVGVMRSPSVAEAAAANLLQGLLVAAPPPPPHDPLTEQQQQQKNVEKEEEGPVAERVRDQPDREAATTSNARFFETSTSPAGQEVVEDEGDDHEAVEDDDEQQAETTVTDTINETPANKTDGEQEEDTGVRLPPPPRNLRVLLALPPLDVHF